MTDNPTNEAPERIYIADELTDVPKDHPFIVAMSHDEWSKEYADDPDFYGTVEYIRADLAQPDLCAVVKPLKWVDNYGLEARAEIDTYLVRETLDGRWEWIIARGPLSYHSSEDGLVYASEDEACRAANEYNVKSIAAGLDMKTVAEVQGGIIAKIQTRIDTLTPAMSPEEDAACLELEKLVRVIREGK